MAAAPALPSPFDPAVLAAPHDLDRRLRDEAPVHRDPRTGVFLVSSYARVLEAVRDPATFSNRFAPAMGGADGPDDGSGGELALLRRELHPIVDTLLTADPPEHRRFRGLVNKAFTPRRVNALADDMTKLTHGLVDAFAARGRCEVLAEYAVPLPLTMIADQLGVPRADLPRLKRWTDGFTAQLSGLAVGEDALEAVRRILEFQRYFAARVEEAREAPRDDILSALVRARLEGERSLDVGECLSILQQLLVAGNETTANAIAEGVRLLIENPEQQAIVRAEPDTLPTFVEEVLRLLSPTQNMWRRTTRDTELGGVAIPAGAMVLLRYGSANRDASVFPDPDRLDVRRPNAADHLAFGHGIHFCLGATLARAEMAKAFRTLLDRLDDLRLAPDAEPPRYRPSILLRGLEALHVEFTPRAAV